MDEKKFEYKVKIKKQSWQAPDKPTNILVLGKPRHGKSHFTKQLLNELFKRKLVKFGIVMSSTAALSGDFDFIPKPYIIDAQDKAQAADKFNQHIQLLRDYGKKHGKEKIPPNFIVFDDVVGKMGNYEETILNFMTTFRHTNSYVITCTQTISKGTSTVLRDCIEWLFIFTRTGESKDRVLKPIWNDFASFLKLDDFIKLLGSITNRDYFALVINICAKDDDPDKFIGYRAPNKKIEEMKWK